MKTSTPRHGPSPRVCLRWRYTRRNVKVATSAAVQIHHSDPQSALIFASIPKISTQNGVLGRDTARSHRDLWSKAHLLLSGPMLRSSAGPSRGHMHMDLRFFDDVIRAYMHICSAYIHQAGPPKVGKGASSPPAAVPNVTLRKSAPGALVCKFYCESTLITSPRQIPTRRSCPWSRMVALMGPVQDTADCVVPRRPS